MPMSQKQIDAPLQPNEAFGQVVRSLRKEKGLSQEELGFRCDLDRTYISGIERGKRNPTIQSIWFIAEGLDELPETLLAKTNEQIENEKAE
ncbi:helix-turn-helix domain-containing protein [Salinibacter ruber]|uniref:helix-turn-helix domain-containing protein n=1 Tax=Salinibacter ruber TaxID=146919 RepID=UPI0021690748|nr:helix-turn-helix transcriptional regulator [Salinibacter ruber]MCS3650371.1 transcriptional regulator with XRE-family HTH domain [Salinibacter ruber]MCS3653623.1 transcriptional regulator with XRE-family HTH domain [Salinibacter ruber]MCS4085841.1 transcriptional regulator with XRE-family HTH domain [Salinibacter ruber]